MPVIARFYGILIAMYFNDHPPPHVHVRYAEHSGRVAIADGAPLTGDLPPRVLGLVAEWCATRRAELEENWRRARAKQPLLAVEPLP